MSGPQHAPPRDAGRYRDSVGFGRPVEVGPAVYSVCGPDDLDHAVGCEFIMEKGILPCSCDATRRRFSDRDPDLPKGWWFRCWFRWMEQRVRPYEDRDRVPWPIQGPDGEPWIGGSDYCDGS